MTDVETTMPKRLRDFELYPRESLRRLYRNDPVFRNVADRLIQEKFKSFKIPEEKMSFSTSDFIIDNATKILYLCHHMLSQNIKILFEELAYKEEVREYLEILGGD